MSIQLQNTGEALDEQLAVDPATSVDQSMQPQDSAQPDQPADTPDNAETNSAESASSNAPTEKELKKKLTQLLNKVEAIGEANGASAKSMVDLVENVVDAAQNNGLSEKNTQKVYLSFRKGQQKGGVRKDGVQMVQDNEVDGKVKSLDQQVSKLRKFVQFGAAFREPDALATDLIARAVTRHVALRNNDEMKKQLKYTSIYAALHNLVSVHLDTDKEFPKGWKDMGGNTRIMTDDEIDAVFLQGEKTPKDGAAFIKAAYEAALKAKTGKEETEKEPGREPIDNADLDAALESLRTAWGDVDPDGLKAYDERQARNAEKEAVAAFKASFALIKADPAPLLGGVKNVA